MNTADFKAKIKAKMRAKLPPEPPAPIVRGPNDRGYHPPKR